MEVASLIARVISAGEEYEDEILVTAEVGVPEQPVPVRTNA